MTNKKLGFKQNASLYLCCATKIAPVFKQFSFDDIKHRSKDWRVKIYGGRKFKRNICCDNFI